MALYVNTNVSSINAQRKLTNATNSLNVSYQRLASGLRINSSKDDAAGLQISNRLSSQINGLNQGNRNANDGIALAQTIEGAMDETTNMLQRIRTLAIQAANGTNTPEDRAALQREVESLSLEITRIAKKTTFAGAEILDGRSLSTAMGASGNGLPGKGIPFSNAFLGKDKAGTGAADTWDPHGMIPSSGRIDFQVGSNHMDLINLANLQYGLAMSGIAGYLSGLQPADGSTYKLSKSGNLIITFNALQKDLQDKQKAWIDKGGKTDPNDTDYKAYKTALDNMNKLTQAYGLKAGSDVNKGGSDTFMMWSVSTADSAQATLKTIDAFIAQVDSTRANLGAIQNRMEATIRNQSSISENESDARSRIRDTDFASETAALTANNIIQQASQTVLAQANQRPTVALSLLGQ